MASVSYRVEQKNYDYIAKIKGEINCPKQKKIELEVGSFGLYSIALREARQAALFELGPKLIALEIAYWNNEVLKEQQAKEKHSRFKRTFK